MYRFLFLVSFSLSVKTFVLLGHCGRLSELLRQLLSALYKFFALYRIVYRIAISPNFLWPWLGHPLMALQYFVHFWFLWNMTSCFLIVCSMAAWRYCISLAAMLCMGFRAAVYIVLRWQSAWARYFVYVSRSFWQGCVSACDCGIYWCRVAGNNVWSHVACEFP